jgi:SAM-dependent methyltransferase
MEELEYERMAAAEERHWWYVGLHDFLLRLVRCASTQRGNSLAILDAGCGTGRLAQLLASFGEVTACDLHPLALEATARRGIQRVLQSDLASSELGTENYDLITCIDVLYHRRIRDEAAALCNLHRALRSGGRLLLQVPAFEALRGSHDVAVHTRRRYRRSDVANLLREAGFTVEWTTCRLFPLFLPMLAWRVLSRGRLDGSAGKCVASDVAELPPSFLNRLLLACVQIENRLITAGLRFPLGTSLFASAKKTGRS